MYCPFFALCAIRSHEEVTGLAILRDSAGFWRLWWLISFMSPMGNFSFGLYLPCMQKELQVTPPPIPAYTLMSLACQQGTQSSAVTCIWEVPCLSLKPFGLVRIFISFFFFVMKGSHSLSLGLPWTHSYPPAVASQVLGLQIKLVRQAEDVDDASARNFFES